MSPPGGRQAARAPPAAHERRFEAVACDWNPAMVCDRKAAAARLRRLVEQACGVGLEVVIVGAARVDDVDGWLRARPSGPGGLTLLLDGGPEVVRVGPSGPQLVRQYAATAGEDGEIGPAGPSDAARRIERELWRHGIAPGQLLGVEHDAFAAALADQIERRRRGEPPLIDDDPTWTLTIDGVDPQLERVHESLLTLADGRLGTRGSVLAANPADDPSVLLSGIYAGSGSATRLLAGPRWNTIDLDDEPPFAVRRVLDLHAGTLSQELIAGDVRIAALQLSSLTRPATALLRISGRGAALREAPGLRAPLGAMTETGTDDGCAWMRVLDPPASIVAASHDAVRTAPPHDGARGWGLDRIACYEGAPAAAADEHAALARLGEARELGFEALLAEHRGAWAACWEDADVCIEGDDELQLAARFAIFHLLGNAGCGGEASVGARGLTGGAYRGHVFWDSDVYVLPFLAAARPQAARAMLEYRVRRLPAALRAARAQGRAGARFPWESAASGEDVTPSQAGGTSGALAPVLTGALEEHIVADVAWAAACYMDWNGDRAFATGPGLELLVQTARWWASRIELDPDGSGHIRGVMGPDEYHERVDDNAYTNVMARWNLRRAADAAGTSVAGDERRRWRALADTLVDGYDAATGLYEQFAGFSALEPLVIAEIAARRPVSADLLLGPDRTRAAQVVKQPDVLMAHYLVPDEVAAGSLEPNLDFYEPRTAHGSSLSPGVHAALLARAGRLDAALDMLRLTARIDLDDIGQTTAGGLHLAAMGSTWRALAFGFAGLRPSGEMLAIDPVLAPGWEALEIRTRFRGSRMCVRVEPDALWLSADPPLTALLYGEDRVELGAAAKRFPPPPPPRREPA